MARNAYLLTVITLAGGLLFAAYMLFIKDYETVEVRTTQSASGEISREVGEPTIMSGINYIREGDNYALLVWASAVVLMPAMAVYAARTERTFLVWWTSITLMILGFTASRDFSFGFGILAALLLISAFLLHMSHRRSRAAQGA